MGLGKCQRTEVQLQLEYTKYIPLIVTALSGIKASALYSSPHLCFRAVLILSIKVLNRFSISLCGFDTCKTGVFFPGAMISKQHEEDNDAYGDLGLPDSAPLTGVV